MSRHDRMLRAQAKTETQSSRGGRPSPAMVLAALALVFAMVGTAVAGTDGITNKITKSKVKSIAKKQVNKAAPGLSVLNAKTADSATTATTATTAAAVAANSVGSAQLSDGAVKAADLGPTTTVSATSGAFANNTPGSVFIQCPEGTAVISGGGEPSAPAVYMTLSRKSGANGWRYDAFNASGANATITVFAYCLAA